MLYRTRKIIDWALHRALLLLASIYRDRLWIWPSGGLLPNSIPISTNMNCDYGGWRERFIFAEWLVPIILSLVKWMIEERWTHIGLIELIMRMTLVYQLLKSFSTLGSNILYRNFKCICKQSRATNIFRIFSCSLAAKRRSLGQNVVMNYSRNRGKISENLP